MKTTLNKLALLMFERKAKKLGLELIDSTKTSIDLDHNCLDHEQVICWNWEDRFVTSEKVTDSSVGSVILGLELDLKTSFHHVGMVDNTSGTLSLYRLSEGEVSSWSYDRSFAEEEESKHIFFQAGRTSWLQ